MSATRTIGLISDTHGLLRPEASARLQGSNLIIHAGDIGNVEILQELEKIAPVRAVRGNNDRALWAQSIPTFIDLDVLGHRIAVIHDLKEMMFEPEEKGYSIIISGHSHRPRIEKKSGVLYVNPGSAGPRRFKLPVAVGRLQVSRNSILPEILELRDR